MKRSTALLSLLFAIGFASYAGAADFAGKVTNSSGDIAKITLDGELVPNVILGLEAIGSKFRVFIDNNFVASFTNSTLSKGGGFTLLSLANGQTPCTAYYDDVRIYNSSAPGQHEGERKKKFPSRKR